MIQHNNPSNVLLTFFLIMTTSVTYAKTTKWTQGAVGYWDVPTFWSNGLPSTGDSAIISGIGSEAIIPNGVFVHVGYVEVENEATIAIDNGALLEIYNKETHGIYIDGAGRLINRGLLSIEYAGSSGIRAVSHSTVENEGTIAVDSCSTGFSIGDNSSLTNVGEIFVVNSYYGILSLGTSTIQNDSLMDFERCHVSIENRHESYFENADSISIKKGLLKGLTGFGEVVNNGSISILEMDDLAEYAVLNDSFTCCDTFYLGKITNNGLIEILDSDCDGLLCRPSSRFFNFGKMDISECDGKGVILEPLARLRVSDGGELTVRSIDDPMEVQEEADLEVESGGLLDIAHFISPDH